MNQKQTLLETIDAFVNQRPGLDPRDYSDGTIEGWRNYRRESASITKDMHDYFAIRGQIAWRDSISADAIIKASESAFAGRLTINDISAHYDDGSTYFAYSIDYCAGQYMPTEYRKAACAVLAAAWWAVTRTDCPDFDTDDCGDFTGNNPGEWMRNTARQTFGLGIQRDWFH